MVNPAKESTVAANRRAVLSSGRTRLLLAGLVSAATVETARRFFIFHPTLLNNPLQRRIQAVPFLEQLLEDARPVLREAVKPFVALIFLAPFAFEQALGFQPPQQGIQRALLNLHPLIRQRFAQCVAVMLFAKLRQHRNDQRPATQFHPQVFEEVGVRELGKVHHLESPTVCRILCHIHYVAYSICCQEKTCPSPFASVNNPLLPPRNHPCTPDLPFSFVFFNVQRSNVRTCRCPRLHQQLVAAHAARHRRRARGWHHVSPIFVGARPNQRSRHEFFLN